jgi:peptidoglycan hydrolase CwlO-like protein
MPRNHLLAFSLVMVVSFSLMYSIQKGREATDSVSDIDTRIGEISSKVDELESNLNEVKSQVESLE